MPGKDLEISVGMSLADGKVNAQLYFDATWDSGINRLSASRILLYLERFAPWHWSRKTQKEYWLV